MVTNMLKLKRHPAEAPNWAAPRYGAIAAAIAAAAVEIGATAATAAIIGSIGATLITSVLSMALSMVVQSLFSSGNHQTANLGQTNGRPRNVTVRQAVAPREIALGEVRKGGIISFIALGGADNEVFHLVVTLSGHPIERIGAIYIAGQLAIDPDGNSVGVYAGLINVEKKLGAVGEPAFAGLIAANLGWTSDHRQDGCASIHLALTWNEDAFSSFDPTQLSFDVWGHNRIYDPRAATFGFNDNAALVVAWYLNDATFGLGVALDDTGFDLPTLEATANLCDEYVGLTETSASVTISGATSQITINEAMQPAAGDTPSGLWAPLIGDRVQLSGALPGEIAADSDYYWIPATEILGSYTDAIPDTFTGYIATTLANALARNFIAVTGDGSGTLTRTAERRYCASGVFTADLTPSSILPGLVSALGGGAGRAFKSAGLWVVKAGAYETPGDVGLGEDDLRRDGFTVVSQAGLRDFCNGVRGKFINPARGWQEDDYPAATDSDLVAAEGGQKWLTLNLPMEHSGSRAQRIATMEFLRNRLELRIPQLPCKLSALQFRPTDTVPFSFARYGWSSVPFEVVAMALAKEEDSDGQPVLGVDLTLKTISPDAYSWTADQAELIPLAPKANLPNPAVIKAPGVPVVSDDLYVTRDGGGVKAKAVVEVAAIDAYANNYRVGYRLQGVANWTDGPWVSPDPTAATVSFEFFDLAPGLYDFRARCMNAIGVMSTYSVFIGSEILGLGAAPADVAHFTVTPINGFGYAVWDAAPDLDVRFGGQVKIRWSPVDDGSATWQNAIDWAQPFDGNQSHATIPLSAGTYLAKFVDSTGQESASAAVFVSTAPDLVTLTGSTTTLTEDPTFGGTKTSCAVNSSLLKMSGEGNWDSITDVDAVDMIDEFGGIAASATYLFASGIDNGSVQKCRIAFSVQVEGVNLSTLVDSRGASVDAWVDWDGASDVSSANGTGFYRETDDDPAGSPSWSDWKRLDGIADAEARAFQFKIEMTTADKAFALWVHKLSASVTLQ